MHQNVKTAEEFDRAVASGKVLVDFWAPWCGPCKMMGEMIDREFGQAGDAVKVVKVNVDEAAELAAKFSVMSIPQLVCFKDGAKVAEFTGVTPAGEILAAFD